MQDKCSLVQLQFVGPSTGARIIMERCVGHKGMMELVTTPHLNIKAVKCSSCSGCQECRQPVPLVIPEGTGGGGCSAEVAAKAEAMQCLAANKATAARFSAAGQQQGGQISQQQTGGTEAVGGASHETGSSTAGLEVSAPANPALVECSVCRRKPGGPGVPATLKLCGACLVARYCSAECQKKDWGSWGTSSCVRSGPTTSSSKDSERPP
jgi:hypothetical protein